MSGIAVQLGPLHLRNPVIAASGTFGYGREYEDLVPAVNLGGIAVKGVSPFPCSGNPPPRTFEVESGMLNAIGLQNPGIESFISHPDYLPQLRQLDTAVIVNIWGKTIEDYIIAAERLEAEQEGIAALEINISCPNIKEGGIGFGTDLKMTAEVVGRVRRITGLPLITKLSPNVSRIADFARCAVDAGSDIISLINTLPAMSIDVASRKPRLANVSGGLSGPAIKPVAVKLVYDTARAVSAPIIGMGGIRTAEDALEFILAGASAIGVGTAIFTDPQCLLRIIEGLENYCQAHAIEDISELRGKVET